MTVDLFRSRAALEAEIWTFRQKINVLRRTAPTKHAFCAVERMIFVDLYRLFSKICDALAIVKPDTIVRWHRPGSDPTAARNTRANLPCRPQPIPEQVMAHQFGECPRPLPFAVATDLRHRDL